MRSRYLFPQLYLKWSTTELLPFIDFVAKHPDVDFKNQGIKD